MLYSGLGWRVKFGFVVLCRVCRVLVLVGCYDYGFGCNYGWCAVVSIAACSGLGGLAVCGCSGLGCFGGLSLVLLVVSLIAIYGYWFVFGRVCLSFVGYGLSGVGLGGCLLLWYFYLLL